MVASPDTALMMREVVRPCSALVDQRVLRWASWSFLDMEV